MINYGSVKYCICTWTDFDQYWHELESVHVRTKLIFEEDAISLKDKNESSQMQYAIEVGFQVNNDSVKHCICKWTMLAVYRPKLTLILKFLECGC